MTSDYAGWKEVRSRADLPWIGRDCLFELRNGLRFYGFRETGDVICAPLWSGEMRQIEWMHIKRWIPKHLTLGSTTGGDGQGAEVIVREGFRQDSRTSIRGRQQESLLNPLWRSTHLTHGSSTD